jgi:hypothetical protein
MMLRRILIVAGLSAAMPILATGCGEGKPTPQLAQVKPGSMPEGGEWSAEYYSENLGTIELIAKNGEAAGKWRRPRGDKWAEFHGTIDGNLMKFNWDEYDVGGVGPNTHTKGKGYFVYTHPAGENVDDVLEGQIGRHEDEVGDEFKAVKQRNVVPDLSKIGGSGASDIIGGDWHENDESGKPEKPTSPNK